MKNFNLKRWVLTLTIYFTSASSLHSIPSLKALSTRLSSLCAKAVREANEQQEELNETLILTTKRNILPVAKTLLARGANPNHVTETGLTPLTWACLRGSIDMVNLLLKSGAYLELETWRTLEGRTYSYSPLTCAIAGQKLSIVILFLNLGMTCPPNPSSSILGKTPWWDNPHVPITLDMLLLFNDEDQNFIITQRRLIKNLVLLASVNTREEFNALLPEYLALQPRIAASSQEVQAAFAHFFSAAHKRVMSLTGRAVRVCQDHTHAPEIAPASSLPETVHSKRKRDDETQDTKRIRHDEDDEKTSLPEAPQISSHGTQSSSAPITMHIVENETESDNEKF
jgi:hypothetical protein